MSADFRDLTQHEIAAQWMYGSEYAKGGLSAIEFWSRLDARRRDLMREMVQEINAAYRTEDAR